MSGRTSIRAARRLALLICVFCAPLSAMADGGALPTLYVIGDSTAAQYGIERYPLFGWAQVLDHYFDDSKLIVRDAAVSGRSSKSFRDEGRWTPIQEALKPGDFVFIQFGHNDQKKDDPKRSTDPYTTYTEQLKRYVAETRATGATPLLLTPINRNSWETPKKHINSLGDYPDAVRKLARDENIDLIDMHKLTHRYYQKLGQERATRLFITLPANLYPVYPEGKSDNTHLREQGAFAVSALAIKSIKKQHLALRDYLKKSHRSWGFSRRLQQKLTP